VKMSVWIYGLAITFLPTAKVLMYFVVYSKRRQYGYQLRFLALASQAGIQLCVSLTQLCMSYLISLDTQGLILNMKLSSYTLFWLQTITVPPIIIVITVTPVQLFSGYKSYIKNNFETYRTTF
jgi:hypothetical protein